MDAIRVLLADDHTLFRKGLRTLLERMPGIEVVGDVSSGDEALARSRDLVPDVILMDVNMPGLSGIEAARHIRGENPHIGIVLVTMFDDAESVFAGMRAGARGYVLKEAEPEELGRAIEAAARGEVMLAPKIAEKLLAQFERDGREGSRTPPELPYEALTQREREVLQLAADGLSNKEIAARLAISEKTAKNHTANIFSKLQVNDRTQAVVLALRRGLVTLPAEGSSGVTPHARGSLRHRTRGDVQPRVALGRGLQTAGHEVIVATHEPFRASDSEHRPTFRTITGNVRAI